MDINFAEFKISGTFLSLFSLIYIYNKHQINSHKKKRDRIQKSNCFSPNEILDYAKSN